MEDEASAERFRREAKVIARLEHPNIIPIHNFGIDERSQIPWMAMGMRMNSPRAVWMVTRRIKTGRRGLDIAGGSGLYFGQPKHHRRVRAAPRRPP